MKFVITGASGFIGSKLVKRIAERGDIVKVLTRNNFRNPEWPIEVEVVKCDLIKSDVGELASILNGVDVLIHCAGQLNDKNNMRELHVDATRKLVTAASGRIKHWVQLSSVGVYGPVLDGEITESTVLNPKGEYEITKTELDQIVIEGAKTGAFSYSILRPSNVFSSDMKNQSLFAMISMVDKGLFFFIGKPQASANYVHVENVVKALSCCATQPAAKGKIYNISDHRSLEHFIGVVAQELGRPVPSLRLSEFLARGVGRVFGKIPRFPLTQSRINALVNRSIYPITHIESELGYSHVISMEEGLHELVAAYKKRK